MRGFEQVISNRKVSSNAISPPCEAKAQTVGEAWKYCFLASKEDSPVVPDGTIGEFLFFDIWSMIGKEVTRYV